MFIGRLVINTNEQLKLFSQQDNCHYWTILFLKIDPLIDNIKDLPEFKIIMNDIGLYITTY